MKSRVCRTSSSIAGPRGMRLDFAAPTGTVGSPRSPCLKDHCMTTLQALLIAFLQGVTELFPVSSLGHAVVLPALFGWNIDQHSPDFVPFLVVLHLGTATALL